jgi:hypothetical protein
VVGLLQSRGGIDIEGAMIGGFALIAAPAEYRVTGVKTLIVSYNGIVYQKDLGPGAPNMAKKIGLYNPDKTWDRTDDQSPTNDSNEAASGPSLIRIPEEFNHGHRRVSER